MRFTLVTVALAVGTLATNVMERQSFDPDDFGVCDPACNPVEDAVDACPPGDVACLCTPAISAGLEQCIQCAGTVPDTNGAVFLRGAVQTLITIFQNSCANSGVPIPTLPATTGTGPTTDATGGTVTPTGTGTQTTATGTGTGTTTHSTTGTGTSTTHTGTSTSTHPASTTSNAASSGSVSNNLFAFVAPLVFAGVAL